MRRRFAAALAACAVLLAQPALGEPCRLPRLAKADLVSDSDGTPLLPVGVNGETQFFELTGDPWSFVFAAEADRLGFGSHHHERDDGLFFDADPVKTRRTAELTIGKVRWREFEFYALARPRPAGSKAIGSLGMDFLENARLDVELNLAAQAINFIQADACLAPPWAPQARALPLGLASDARLPVSLDGHALTGVIFPRLAVSRIDISALTARFALAPGSAGVRLLTEHDPDSGGHPIFGVTFKALEIGDAALLRPPLQVVDMHVDGATAALHRRLQALNPYGFAPNVPEPRRDNVIFLGRAELSRLRIYFMFHAGKAFVTPIPQAPDTAISTAPLPDMAQ